MSTKRKQTKREALQGRLDVLLHLHTEQIILGWHALGCTKYPEDSLGVKADIENRGRQGLVAGVYVTINGIPMAVMSIERAYYYANIGASIQSVRNFMQTLGED